MRLLVAALSSGAIRPADLLPILRFRSLPCLSSLVSKSRRTTGSGLGLQLCFRLLNPAQPILATPQLLWKILVLLAFAH